MLHIDNLSIRFGDVCATHRISLSVAKGETLGIVGESGSGKSMLALATIGLLPAKARATGRILFDGTDLLGLPDKALDAYRGARIGMIFQEPMSALNPAMTIGRQITEGMRLSGLSRAAARSHALGLLDRVQIPQSRARSYPHELSGGQRQRVCIAIALARQPDLLIADEPTTALDTTVQADILDLLDSLRREFGLTMLFISHDLGVINRIADRVMVMYRGTHVETGPTAQVLHAPAQDYTKRLIAALPRRQPPRQPQPRRTAAPQSPAS
ncbi:ABC transporter ATP-binding protein [Thioclava sp. GXIMD4216]|uniref:ABC transporter ATP-binding protein n=1 Tax=Thioclava sp. GXIMD4216 TaxID=3131929 RepID=UPI0030CDEB64